jgi:hypothetical protein
MLQAILNAATRASACPTDTQTELKFNCSICQWHCEAHVGHSCILGIIDPQTDHNGQGGLGGPRALFTTRDATNRMPEVITAIYTAGFRE